MERQILGSLHSWKQRKNRKPIIINGVRQVGKTHTLRKFGEKEFSNFHYFNFEEDGELSPLFERNLKPDRIISELQFHSGRSINFKNDLLIFDEIQECGRALTSLKYFHESLPELAICSAGSLLGVHLSPSSFPVGQVEILNMYPLSFLEFLMAVNENEPVTFLQEWNLQKEIPMSLHLRLWEWLKVYFIVGGLPEVVQTFVKNESNRLVAFREVRKNQEQLITAYLADAAKHAGKANAMHLERILRAIPSQISKSQDGSVQRFQFKGVVPKVDKYARLSGAIDWLEKARLILKVHMTNSGNLPFSAFIKESRFKLLMFDIGILGAMSNLSVKSILNYDYGTYKGYFAENFVAQELICSGTPALYSWEEDRSEIEFLLEKGGKALPVEVKSGRITKAKSLSKFMQKYNPHQSVILSAKEAHPHSNPIQLPLYLAGQLQAILA